MTDKPEQKSTIVFPNDYPWKKISSERTSAKLFHSDVTGENSWMEKWNENSNIDWEIHPGGEEFYVWKGSVSEDFSVYKKGTWVRYPPNIAGKKISFKTGNEGATLYFKSGHLTPFIETSNSI